MAEEIVSFAKEFNVDLDISNLKEFDKNYYLVDNRFKTIIDSVPIEPVYAGLFVGEIDSKTHKFIPSLMFMDFLSTQSDCKINVRKKSEFLFTCGRDLFKESVAKFDIELERNQLVLILDHLNRFLGMGKVKNNFDNISNKDVFIESLYDVGDFLRREVKKFNKSKRRRK